MARIDNSGKSDVSEPVGLGYLLAMVGKDSVREGRARRLLKIELARADVGYAELARRLREIGLEETEGAVKAKMHRGTFSADFFLSVIEALGRTAVRLDD